MTNTTTKSTVSAKDAARIAREKIEAITNYGHDECLVLIQRVRTFDAEAVKAFDLACMDAIADGDCSLESYTAAIKVTDAMAKGRGMISISAKRGTSKVSVTATLGDADVSLGGIALPRGVVASVFAVPVQDLQALAVAAQNQLPL